MSVPRFRFLELEPVLLESISILSSDSPVDPLPVGRPPKLAGVLLLLLLPALLLLGSSNSPPAAMVPLSASSEEPCPAPRELPAREIDFPRM